MNLQDKVKAIKFIYPDADFVATDNSIEFLNGDFDTLTDAEILKAFNNLQAKVETDLAIKQAAKAAAEAKLTALGLTADDLKALGL